MAAPAAATIAECMVGAAKAVRPLLQIEQPRDSADRSHANVAPPVGSEGQIRMPAMTALAASPFAADAYATGQTVSS